MDNNEMYLTGQSRIEHFYIKDFFAFIFQWLQRESPFIFWMTALNLPCVIADFLNNCLDRAPFQILFYGFFRVSAIIFMISFMAILLDIILCCVFRIAYLNRVLKNILLVFSGCMFLVNLFILYYYRARIDEAILKMILGTKAAEAAEFFEVYIVQWRFIGFVLLFILGLFVLRWFYLKLSRSKIFWVVTIVCSIIAGIGGWLHPSKLLTRYFSVAHVPSMLLSIAHERQDYEQTMKGAKLDITLTKNESSIPYVAFILGESTNRNHMSLYGYPLPTTPRLMERNKEGALCVFQDTISPHGSTIPVMEKLFTFYRNDSTGKWFTYANLFSILRLAGYHVEWLSNQEGFGPLSYVSQFYAEQGGIRKFAMAFASGNEMANYDGKLLPILEKSLQTSQDKNFYVLHLMGAHGKYLLRYPKEFGKFSYQDEKDTGKKFSNEQRQTRAEYDNAVLYNDFVVDEIIRRFEDKDAIVIYISDHGEDVYDELDFAGHSFDTRHGCEIPMIMWASRQFRTSHPELYRRIEKSVDRPFMTDDMIHVILDLLDIETEDYDPRKSVINDAFDETRERISEGKIYDKARGLRRR